MSMYYAGIGSRETPNSIMVLMADIAQTLAGLGYTLRSGGAGGADTAFEEGCDRVNGPKLIYIPWNGFSGRRKHDRGIVTGTSLEAEQLAARFHPNWNACSPGAKALHARNGFQMLGVNLNEPSKFVVCWTPGAGGSGGTGQAIRIAKHFGIPVFDLADRDNFDRLARFVNNVA